MKSENKQFLSTDEWINVGISITLYSEIKKKKNAYMENFKYISKQHYELKRLGQTHCSTSITLNYRTSITFNITYLMLEYLRLFYDRN